MIVLEYNATCDLSWTFHNNKRIKGYVLASFSMVSRTHCMYLCEISSQCKAVAYGNNWGSCDLFEARGGVHAKVEHASGWHLYESYCKGRSYNIYHIHRQIYLYTQIHVEKEINLLYNYIQTKVILTRGFILISRHIHTWRAYMYENILEFHNMIGMSQNDDCW